MKGKESTPHIGIVGRRNNGKSSLINALTGQDIAIVSEQAGTTTDPVKKSIEIFGIGPVILVDTAGIDDIGELGEKRMNKSWEILKTIDLAIVVINRCQWEEPEINLTHRLQQYEIPFIIVNNKIDKEYNQRCHIAPAYEVINVSALTGLGIQQLIKKMVERMPHSAYISHSLLGNLIRENDTVVLITPIDSEAPEGRLILPQVQMIRDVLDHEAIATVLKENKIENYLQNNPAPQMIITDSQVFGKVAPLIPENIPLTGFSIVLAHHKGHFEAYLQGTPTVENLQDNDRILILESCTHLTSCEDIGRVKIPTLLKKYTGKKLHFTFVSGLNQIPDIQQFALVIQCGGCMITRKQLINRLKPALDHQVPVTNYGMLIAYLNGMYHRAIQVFLKK
ncbi:MAG: [FeFe] hydrogenase H-cluster maturation GTPase HydF [Bacteroidales bacterium]